MVPFVLDFIRRRTGLMVFFWSACMVFLGIALFVRINISGYFLFKNIFMHTLLGLIIIPLIYIPVHELLHIIPYYFTGARNIRIGMDLSQYMFYVTAHRYVANEKQFRFVAWSHSSSGEFLFLYCIFPEKWSLSLLLFMHTTMCAW
jgi:hypothetical protein